MKITIPRPLETNTRIYGIGIRQFVYLAIGLALGFLAALAVPAGVPVRLIAGAFFLMIALALAFMKVNGHYVDGHIINIMHYLRSPHTRVWNKAAENTEFVYEPVDVAPPPKTKAISFELRREESIPASLAIAAVNLLVLLIISSVFYYIAYSGGWRDIQYWLGRGGY